MSQTPDASSALDDGGRKPGDILRIENIRAERPFPATDRDRSQSSDTARSSSIRRAHLVGREHAKDAAIFFELVVQAGGIARRAVHRA